MLAEDRISALPDEVISHILYFLPTRDVVATSVLSKRWHPLWRSVPVIDLSDERVVTNKETCLQFSEFVSSFVLSRDVTQPIKRFSLKSVYKTKNYSSDQNLNIWVNVVLQRKVEHLELMVGTKTNLLPIGILSCKTLVVLKLNGFSNVNDVSPIELPSLKILHLEAIKFAQDRCLLQLLSGCPNLEDFHASSVFSASHDDSFKECISLTKLIKLIRANISFCDIKFLFEALYNVEYLCLHIVKAVPPYYNHIPDFYNLTQMKLSFPKYKWQWSVELLKHCPKLQILNIREMKKGHDKNWARPEFVPECVSLKLRECTIRNYEGKKVELHFARYIMQNAIVLQTMQIHCNQKAKLKVKAQLSMCKRRSTTCHLLIF